MEQVSGVYAIVHPPSGRSYIGSSKDVIGRWAGHQKSLSRNEHHSSYLQNAWNKYGKDAFVFVFLELCARHELISREQFWIDQGQASNPEFGFNLSRLAHAPQPSKDGRARIAESNKRRTGTPWKASDPKSWKDKISASRTGKKYGPRNPKVGRKISESLKGQKLTEERKAKISAANKGKIRGPHSEEHRRKLSLAHRSRKEVR